jgi:O-antigen/teichoic acid export membrane protein
MSYVAICFSIVAGLLYTPWMIRTIGRVDYGLFTLAISILTYLAMDFGVGTAIARFIANYKASGDDDKIDVLVSTAVRLYLLIDLIIVVALIIMFFCIEGVFVSLTPSELEKFKVVFCIVALFGIVAFPALSLKSILIAYERFIVLKFCDLMLKFLTVCLMVLALLAGYGLYSLVAIHAVVSVFVIVFQFIYIRKNIPVRFGLSYFDRSLVKELFHFCAWLTIIMLARGFRSNFAPTLIGIFSGAAEISIFGVAFALTCYVQTFAAALGGLFLAKVSRIMAEDDIFALNRLMIRVGRIQVLILGLLWVGFVVLGQEFIKYWIGDEFQRSYTVALIFSFPAFFTNSLQVPATALVVKNKLVYLAISMVLTVLLCLGLSAILVPCYGAIGSGVSICVSMLVGEIAIGFYYHFAMKMDMTKFLYHCHVKMFPAILLSLGGGFLISWYVPAHSMLTFMPKVALVGTLYVALTWGLAMNRDEKRLVMSFAKYAFRRTKSKRD